MQCKVFPDYICSMFAAGKYHEQFHIDNESVGNSYETVLGRYFEPTVTLIEVEDPYIRSVHQVRRTFCCCFLINNFKGAIWASINIYLFIFFLFYFFSEVMETFIFC